MSTSLTTLVPVLNGTNYTSWAPIMQSFLMSQGQWKVILNPPPKAIYEKAEETLETSTEEKEATIKNQQEILDWWDLNAKALGNLRLHLHHTIQYNQRETTTAAGLWETLELKYSKPGMAQFIWSSNRCLIRPSQPTPTHLLPLRKSLPTFGSSKRLKRWSPSRPTCRPLL